METVTKAFNEVVEDIKTQTVPSISKNMGILCFLLNVFLPGVGSMVAGAMESKWSTVIIGVLQLLTCWFILGWIWSIWWGWLIFSKSSDGFSPLG
eukprot:CAMPEP_0173386298 /NCGR_PEP_ID=MMETSP1356-20130122/8898_1 /TAXON_ID=77927 ORGANISM="Hemiselmis virescens, Strain PCC157" /NCGR_SAMPLE_ID=MMETSP1356 /ASSEMBLY_ACC=CAM_ASM_000847 /LENGTH=94 /DNA_ID=CAMNT_0014342473 /DNA_START=46 /DNA_END=330 /DNA_ORIENTATION=+